MNEKVEISAELLKKIAEDPKYLQRAISSNERESFKDKYGVTKASGLRCPACSQYGTGGGSLWWDPAIPHNFTCRKCERTWRITCEKQSIFEVIKEVKGK